MTARRGPRFELDTLAVRLRGAFWLLTVLVLLSGSAGLWAVLASASRVEQLSSVLTPAVEANAASLSSMLSADAAVRGYVATGDRTYRTAFEQSRREVVQNLARAEALAARADVEADVEAERAAAVRWLDELARPVVSGEQDPGVDPVGASTLAEFRSQNAEVARVLTERREVVRGETRTVRRVAVPGLVAMTLVFVVLAAAGSRSAVQAVETPLSRLRAVLDRLRLGDHTARADARGAREVREVAAATNALADESERLRAERDATAALQQASRDAARAVREALDRDVVMRTAAEALGALARADAVVLRHAHRGAAGIVSEPGDPPEPVAQLTWPGTDGDVVPQGLTREVLTRLRTVVPEGEVMAVADVRDAVLAPAVREALVGLEHASSAVVAAIGGSDDVVGAAILVFDEPRTVTAGELQALQLVCADLTRALEHSGIYERQLQLVERLQELDRQKSDFLSTVSHELRTPLTSITGYTELLQDGAGGELTPAGASMVDVVRRNAERLAALIEDLLTLSHIEAGTLRTTRTIVDLEALVHGAVLTVGPLSAARSVTVRVDAVPARVTGDPAQVERVLLNLLSNAVKFTPTGGSVEVTVRPVDQDVLTVVADTGIGIPAADQAQLFDRFFRASNAVATAVPGTGLGLSIVQRIVEAHGGTLTLASTEGSGTTVEVRLPAAPGDDGTAGDGRR